MAILSQYGKLTGTVEEPLLPVTVWDDTPANLSAEVAVDTAKAAAPTTLFGWPRAAVPSIEQLSNAAWLVTFTYRPKSPSTPAAPPVGEVSVAYRMSFQAEPKYIYDSFACLGVYDTDGKELTLSRLKVNVRKVAGVNRVIGMQVNPLTEALSIDVVLPNATLTAAYRKDLESLKYKFNDAPFMGYGIGELQLVRFQVAVRTDEDWQLSFGFGAGETRTDVPFDGNDAAGKYKLITVDKIPPYAITWTIDRDVLIDFKGTIETLADFVVVQRVWEFGDFTKLGLGSL